MKTMVNSFKWSLHTLLYSVTLHPAAVPPTLTHASTRDPWTLAGNSGSVSLVITASFSWVLVCTWFCLCSPRVCFLSPVYILMALCWGYWWPPPRRLMPHPALLYSEPLPMWQAIADLNLHRRQSNTQRSDLSFCGISQWAQGFVWALWAFLVGWDLILNVILPLLPSYYGFSFVPGHGVSFFLVRSNIRQLMVIQQWVVILEFSQEKMSARPSTPPSASTNSGE